MAGEGVVEDRSRPLLIGGHSAQPEVQVTDQRRVSEVECPPKPVVQRILGRRIVEQVVGEIAGELRHLRICAQQAVTEEERHLLAGKHLPEGCAMSGDHREQCRGPIYVIGLARVHRELLERARRRLVHSPRAAQHPGETFFLIGGENAQEVQRPCPA
ncbi:hypothetical protein [Nonomuraea angiospora]